jgi:hypothetical protein
LYRLSKKRGLGIDNPHMWGLSIPKISHYIQGLFKKFFLDGLYVGITKERYNTRHDDPA